MSFDVISLIITLAISVSGWVIAIVQWISGNKINKANYLRQMHDKIREDSDFIDVLYKIDYGDDWYNDTFHEKSGRDFQAKIDSFLSFLSYLYYLRKVRILSRKDFVVFEYTIKRVCANYQVQPFLWNLHNWSKRNSVESTYKYLVDYIKKTFFTEAEFVELFESEDSRIYPKYLNF